MNKEHEVVMDWYERHILVVDCDEVARLLVSYILEQEGYGARSVHDIHEARYELKRHRYDAVLVNSYAQGTTAIILRRCRDGMACTPTQMMLSEWDDRTASANVWQPVAWLHKPFEASMFLYALRAILHEPVMRPRLFAGHR